MQKEGKAQLALDHVLKVIATVEKSNIDLNIYEYFVRRKKKRTKKGKLIWIISKKR